jgi:hypothetical protein
VTPADGELGPARRVPARGNAGLAWLCRLAGEEPGWRRSWPAGGGPKEADRENGGRRDTILGPGAGPKRARSNGAARWSGLCTGIAGRKDSGPAGKEGTPAQPEG